MTLGLEAATVPSAVDPNRTGVLIIRVWSEPGDAGQRLTIRMTARRDVTCDQQETRTTSAIEDAVAQTEAWLRTFA